MRKITLLFLPLLTLLYFSIPKTVFAHPGNTASDGCHYCRTRCDYWGEAWNARHCHGGYTAPVIINTNTPTPRPTNSPTPKPTKTPTPNPTSTPTNGISATETESTNSSTTNPQVAGSSTSVNSDSSGSFLPLLVIGGIGYFIYRKYRNFKSKKL